MPQSNDLPVHANGILPVDQVALSFRCNYSLQQMSPCEEGFFCPGCKKTVVDFRNVDRDAFDKVVNGMGAVCGLFDTHQVSPEAKKRWPARFAAGLLVALGLSSWGRDASAQTAGAPLPVQAPDTPGAKPFVYGYIEQQPEFSVNVPEFIQKNLRPVKLDQGGKVFVRFMVDSNGKISQPKVVKGLSEEANAEAVRVVCLLPVKYPAREGSRKVSVYFTVPVVFKPKQELMMGKIQNNK